MTTARPDDLQVLLAFIGQWWWVLLIFGGAITAFLEGVRDFVLSPFIMIGEARHQHKLELARARAGTQLPSPVRPGPCVHRNVVPVIAASEDRVSGWLCRSCDAQLPADWAVREEDL